MPQVSSAAKYSAQPKLLSSICRVIIQEISLIIRLLCTRKYLRVPSGFGTWWRHQMETFSALLALCAGNSPVPVNSPHKGQWRGTLAGDLRRHRAHYDITIMCRVITQEISPIISMFCTRKYLRVPSGFGNNLLPDHKHGSRRAAIQNNLRREQVSHVYKSCVFPEKSWLWYQKFPI